MDEKEFARKHHSLDQSRLNNDRFRDHLNDKFGEVSTRIKSLKKLISAERDELISENQRLRKENRNLKNKQIQQS